MKRNIMIALLIIVSATTHAQSLKDLFSKDNIKNAIETVVDKATGKEMSVTGTWTYEKCKIEFESDNFLQKAGGAIAATKTRRGTRRNIAKDWNRTGQNELYLQQ